MKKIIDYEKFKNTLPYQSEMFGVYQPLLGWKSKRILERFIRKKEFGPGPGIEQLAEYFDNESRAYIDIKSCQAGKFQIDFGDYSTKQDIRQHNSVLLTVIGEKLASEPARTADEWKNFLSKYDLKVLLESEVFPRYQLEFTARCQEDNVAFNYVDSPTKKKVLEEWLNSRLKFEAKVARTITELYSNQSVEILNSTFYGAKLTNSKDAFWNSVKNIESGNGEDEFEDPYLTFDPATDIKNVSLSPIGIVHLFRQFFFEFDTFLGTPTGHVWMAPGSTVELIETSTRKTIVEKYVESSYETITKKESSITEQDEISEAIKKDNKDDLKLGFSTTVNQSWGTGDSSATASINMDKTQQVARENSHKKMREQSQKLSAEIRENFKSTFKTITEVTDTSSKRYVLANNTQKLINYELRRKMRQVGVQVQDIGSYLCWETYVDEPGKALGLANLIHIASPADLLPQPDVNDTPMPPDKFIQFQVDTVWDFDERQFNEHHPDVGYEFIPLTTYQIPAAEEGFELDLQAYKSPLKSISFGAINIPLAQPMLDQLALLNFIPINQLTGVGEDFHGTWGFAGMYTANNQQIKMGVHARRGLGMGWDKRIEFKLGGTLKYVPTAAKKAEIAAANAVKRAASDQATLANQRKTEESYLKSVKERVEMASAIKKRKYEDLREEERIVIYRNLIGELMTSAHYDANRSEEESRDRHVMAELINSIFDINKMLYFVAPEWWQPRERSSYVGINQLMLKDTDSMVSWGDNQTRPDNYLITDKSEMAPLGSSLGWLLQLDGDNLRNAFLNAPWVKSVIPIRPGREKAAIKWLQNVGVEGSDGLANEYAAPQAELDEIRAKLLLEDPNDEVKDHAHVTIGDAIRFLCLQVSTKHEESTKPDIYPKGAEINDTDKVSATPIDKVYEYGFYPLQGSFRYDPTDPDPANPDRNFQVFDQWVEILPTDQIVPVEVEYDPKTGKQK